MAIFDDNHGLGRQKIIGWALGKGMTAEETVIEAFLMAITNSVIMNGLIFHSDRGVQYLCKEFRTFWNQLTVSVKA